MTSNANFLHRKMAGLFDNIFVSLRSAGDDAREDIPPSEGPSMVSRRDDALLQWIRVRADYDLDQAKAKISWKNGACTVVRMLRTSE